MKSKDSMPAGCALIFLLGFILYGIWTWTYEVFPKEVVTGTIIDTQIEGGETYFIFEHDSGQIEILENEDSWLAYGKINASDYLPILQQGGRFRLTLVGKRIPFVSAYRNILYYEKLDQDGSVKELPY